MLLVHADWSAHPGKRWMACARRQRDGRYRAYAPRPVGPLETWWKRLSRDADRVLVGFDFPLGLPAAYATRAGIEDFADELPRFGGGRWRRFYDVAATAVELGLDRPFYPARPGGRRRAELVEGLGLEGWSALHRRCDQRTPSRPAACPMFWTLGGNQVGKAAISGWRDLLAPALRRRLDVALWPFRGDLLDLTARHRFVVAETYPGEIYGHLGLALRAAGGKRSREARRGSAPRLLGFAQRHGIALHPQVRTAIDDGFGPDHGGDDGFDAVVGLFGLLEVVLGVRSAGAPHDPVARRVEGWILGQEATETSGANRANNYG